MYMLMVLLLSVTEPTPKLCKYKVIVYRNAVPTCTYKEISRLTAEGRDKVELYTDIQTKVCAVNGHAILMKSETYGSTGMTLTGIAVRCNVPFLLPSDLRPRE